MVYKTQRYAIYEIMTSGFYGQYAIMNDIDRQGATLESNGVRVVEICDGYLSTLLGHRIDAIPLTDKDKSEIVLAREKKIFLISEYNQIPIDLLYEIIDESINLADFKEEQVHKLIGLIKSDDPQNYIKSYFKNN